MIRDTLENTKAATFCIEAPDESRQGLPVPRGTGFFISPDGWFVTAAHVVPENERSDGEQVAKLSLIKEFTPDQFPSPTVVQPVLKAVLPEMDFALLKFDFDRHSAQEFLKEKDGFPYVEASSRDLDEGEPVYSFGYPLPSVTVQEGGNMTFAFTGLCPRTTSAIVSSKIVQRGPMMTEADPKMYVLDKALNYGNSGGPIVSTSTGHAHAFCSSFQPLGIRQKHLRDGEGNAMTIFIPSLYGIVASLSDPRIVQLLRDNGVAMAAN